MAEKKLVKISDFVFGEDERAAVNRIMDKNQISEGEECALFEKNFAKLIGTNYCTACNSGTSALMLVWQALKYHSKYKLQEGQKILTTPLTYIATANSIVTTGFEPVFIDINENNLNLSEELLEEHLENLNDSKKYAGILPVHLLGYPCNMKKINSIAKKFGLVVVEDSAESHFSKFNGKVTGSMGLAGCFSFYLTHNIQVGEFGAITTNDNELAQKCRSLKGNGRICTCSVPKIHNNLCSHEKEKFNPRFLHEMIGYNFKPMEMQGAIGNVQLKKIFKVNIKRRQTVKILNELLEKNTGQLKLPEYSNEVAYLGYPLIVIDKKISRNKLTLHLSRQGIENRPIFNSIPTQQPAFSHLKKNYDGKLPRAEFIGKNGFYVGCHQFLSENDLDYIANSIKSGLKHSAKN